MHVAGSRYCLQQVINLPFFQICRSDLLSYVVEHTILSANWQEVTRRIWLRICGTAN